MKNIPEYVILFSLIIRVKRKLLWNEEDGSVFVFYCF
jgi:hypothetical protein